eukprot:6463404-Amphidinium_carterae.1
MEESCCGGGSKHKGQVYEELVSFTEELDMGFLAPATYAPAVLEEANAIKQVFPICDMLPLKQRSSLVLEASRPLGLLEFVWHEDRRRGVQNAGWTGGLPFAWHVAVNPARECGRALTNTNQGHQPIRQTLGGGGGVRVRVKGAEE